MESDPSRRVNSARTRLVRALRGARGKQRLGLARRAALLFVIGLALDLGIQAFRQAREHQALSRSATFVNDDGRRIRYLLRGGAQPGPTVVLISGFSSGLEQWDELQEHLRAHAPVLAYDRGGLGLSDPGLGYDADAQADELARLAKLAKLKLPLVLLGYSSSAFTARAFARRHPELLGGIVLLDPTLPDDILGKTWGETYARRVQYERSPLLAAFKAAIGFMRPKKLPPGAPPAQKHVGVIMGWRSHWWAAYREGRQIARSAQESELDWSKLNVPVALLSVAQEHGTPETKRRFLAHRAMAEAAGATFVNRPGWRHDQIVHEPAFLRELAGVVASVSMRARSALPTPPLPVRAAE